MRVLVKPAGQPVIRMMADLVIQTKVKKVIQQSGTEVATRVFKNTFFTEHLWATTPGGNLALISIAIKEKEVI